MLGYTASIGVMFWFLRAALNITPEWMPIYIPICVDLGIFLGISINHIWSQSQEYVGRLLRSTFGLISQYLGPERDENIEIGRTGRRRRCLDVESQRNMDYSHHLQESSPQSRGIAQNRDHVAG